MQEKQNLENSIENLYNVKVKQEYFRDEGLIKKIKENGFEIKRELPLISTYCLELYIPENIEKVNDYKNEKIQSLRNLDYILRIDESVQMKALNKNQETYETSQDQQPY
jgi:hypothetical protein